MKKIILSEKLPILLWLDEIEEEALNQAKNLANLPFAFRHIAIMPDSHVGYGMPIGGVLATKNVVIPNAVGVDIGCGMCAMETNLTEISKEKLKQIMSLIREKIPVGFNHHKEKQDEKFVPILSENVIRTNNQPSIIESQKEAILYQIGTLGGGNHFLEIQKGKNTNHIWIMIHSGSRNLGKKVADYYNRKAIELNTKWYNCIHAKTNLAFLPLDSEIGKSYLFEMQYCIDFAFANRKLMMQRIKESFQEIIPETKIIEKDNKEFINIAHNYARMENHFGHNVMVHRKGATSAKKDEIGIIPGSQGTKSYIVKGLGNRESFMSCSHGAGRKLGRNQARRELNLEEEIKKMNEKGIIHGIRNQKDLDEAAGAYKDIDQVMENQKDLVSIVEELTPLAVIKG